MTFADFCEKSPGFFPQTINVTNFGHSYQKTFFISPQKDTFNIGLEDEKCQREGKKFQQKNI